MTRKNAKRKYKEGANLQGSTERKALHQVEFGEIDNHYDLHEAKKERERQMAAATPELHSTRTSIKGVKTLRRLKAIANTHEIAPHELESLPVDAPPALKPKDLPVIESDMPPVVSEELQRANQLHQLAMVGDSDGPMLESSFIVRGTHDNASRIRDYPERGGDFLATPTDRYICISHKEPSDKIKSKPAFSESQLAEFDLPGIFSESQLEMLDIFADTVESAIGSDGDDLILAINTQFRESQTVNFAILDELRGLTDDITCKMWLEAVNMA